MRTLRYQSRRGTGRHVDNSQVRDRLRILAGCTTSVLDGEGRCNRSKRYNNQQPAVEFCYPARIAFTECIRSVKTIPAGQQYYQQIDTSRQTSVFKLFFNHCFVREQET